MLFINYANAKNRQSYIEHCSQYNTHILNIYTVAIHTANKNNNTLRNNIYKKYQQFYLHITKFSLFQQPGIHFELFHLMTIQNHRNKSQSNNQFRDPQNLEISRFETKCSLFHWIFTVSGLFGLFRDKMGSP